MKNILVLSNTAFSIRRFRLHYLKKLSHKYKILICTPDKLEIGYHNNIFCKNFGSYNFLIDFFNINNLFKTNKEIDLILAYSFKYQFMYLF